MAIDYEKVILASRGDVRHEQEMKALVDTVNGFIGQPDIATNTAAIAVNTADIATNTAAIATNTTNIAKQPVVVGEARLFPVASVPAGWTANAWVSPDASVVWATRN